MTGIRSLSCVCVLLAAGWPAVSSAQAAPLERPRAADRNELTLIVLSSARRVSLLSVAPQRTSLGSPRGWPSQDPSPTDQPVSVVLSLDSLPISSVECSMPVARRAAETIARMPTASVDATLVGPGVVKLRGCTNLLDRTP